jgi:hypothetical protein
MEHFIIVFFLTAKGVSFELFDIGSDAIPCRRNIGSAVEYTFQQHKLRPQDFLGAKCFSTARI